MRDVQSVLGNDLPDATSQLVVVKLSVSPSKRLVKQAARLANRKSLDLRENLEEEIRSEGFAARPKLRVTGHM